MALENTILNVLIVLLEPMAFSMLKAKHMFMYSAKTKASKSVVRMQSEAFYPKPHFLACNQH